MTRQRYESLCRAFFNVAVAKKTGIKVDGKILKHQRAEVAKRARENHESYQAAWDSIKDLRERFGFQ